MRRLWVSLISGVLVGVGCARQNRIGFQERAFFTHEGLPRPRLLGLSADTLPKIEEGPPYYRDELGYVYRLTERVDSLEVWIEYYIGSGGEIRTVSFTYETPKFRVLTKRYQDWRSFLQGVYGMSQGHVGHEVWQTAEGQRVRLVLSPERRYLQVSFSLLSQE
jgi:hypothetical protein